MDTAQAKLLNRYTPATAGHSRWRYGSTSSDSEQAVKTAMSLDGRVLKEPRGFMKVLQFIFSIFAFATTTSFSSYFSFRYSCILPKENETQVVTVAFEYPFRLDHGHEIVLNLCKEQQTFSFFGDFSSDSQFFVTTGVLAFLYSIAAIVLYVMYNNMYESNPNIPLADFIITVVLAVFWLSGSAAWANGLTGLKYAANPQNWIESQKPCQDPKATCKSIFAGNFAGLNISVIFGFLDFFLWAANLWFLYKETPWFKQKQDPSAETGSGNAGL